MAAPKRRHFVPVLPAVGIAAVAATPLLQALAGGPASPVSASLSSSHDDSSHQAVGAAGHGNDDGGTAGRGAKGGDGRKPFHSRGHGPTAWKPKPGPGSPGPTTTAAPLGSTTTTTAVQPTTTTTDPQPTTTTTAAPQPTTTTTAAPQPTTTTTAAPTTTTTAAPKTSPLVLHESFTQLVNGKPMLLALSVDNTAAAAQSVTVSVSVSGSTLAPYLNVNNDSTQVDLTNWNCTPNELRPSGAGPFVFTCTASIPANTTNTVMVTTGSNLPAGAKGTSVTIQASVTADTPAGTPFPTPASLTQAVA